MSYTQKKTMWEFDEAGALVSFTWSQEKRDLNVCVGFVKLGNSIANLTEWIVGIKDSILNLKIGQTFASI